MITDRLIALSELTPHTHLRLVPENKIKKKMPNLETDIDFYQVKNNEIIYGVTIYSDGYVIPAEWIKNFIVIE